MPRPPIGIIMAIDVVMTKDYDLYIFCHKNEETGPICFYDKVGTGYKMYMYTHMFDTGPKKPKLPKVESKFEGKWVKVKNNQHLITILT